MAESRRLSAPDLRAARRRLRKRDDASDRARLPDPTLPPGTDRLPQIEHVVVLMMENHSFDNYFGLLGHGDGLPLDANGEPTVTNSGKGGPVRAFHTPKTSQASGVPTQSWHASHLQFNDGANDGFVSSIEATVPGGNGSVAMGYWTAADLPFYAALARTFTLADHWYSSCLGPTFPNRRFLVAGTAHGLIDDVLVGMIDYPETGTVFDLLDRNGITWANYHHVKPLRALVTGLFARGRRALALAVAGFFPGLLAKVQGNLQFTTNVYPLSLGRVRRHLHSIEQFFTDANAGTLPAFSVVDPDFGACSEENPQDVQTGEGFAAAIINAIMHSPAWPHTVVFWLYDEHGGYYDHVSPGPADEPDHVLPRSLLSTGGPLRWLLHTLNVWKKLEAIDTGAGRYDRFGFRVPAVCISPFARAGKVSTTTYDHTSILRFVEDKWNLPPLTERDANATSPIDMLALDQPPAFPAPPTLPPPARSWPPDTPALPLRVRLAARVGLVKTDVQPAKDGTP